ncbi:unnamed protein product [Ambrosiozyma monospora]|uniref:Unnamed protein product n=1 Tax=Ambrosiozyma monospora TaxID=43982 RepID=A0A9W6T7E3_AMBMO|nr:unnamed protein product [Ambrosiozyma monospora]
MAFVDTSLVMKLSNTSFGRVSTLSLSKTSLSSEILTVSETSTVSSSTSSETLTSSETSAVSDSAYLETSTSSETSTGSTVLPVTFELVAESKSEHNMNYYQ